MIRLLFVCTGNICRSPTAEGIARAMIRQAGLAGHIAVDSAGTEGYHQGQRPDPRSCRLALRHGIDLSDLRARQVRDSDFERFDLILALDRGHRTRLLQLCPPPLAGRVALLMDFAGEEREIDVPDPYYGEIGGFEATFLMIECGVTVLIAEARKRWGLGAQADLFGG